MKALVLCILLLVPGYISAKWVDAYVETNCNEIIYGKIQLPKMDFYSGALYVKGFDLSYLYRYVKFKSANTGKVIYSPDEIKGYGFTYDGKDYFFITQQINFKSIVKNERQKAYFMSVVYKGSLTLCKYRKQLDEERPVAKIILYEEYFIYSEQQGLTKLQVDNEHKSIKTILHKYGVSELFLRNYEKLTVRDVKDVLFQYDLWLSERKEPAQLVI